MALFPSCSGKPLFPSAQEEPSSSKEKELSWLDNTSFKQPPPVAPPPEAKRQKKHHREKHSTKQEKKAVAIAAPAKPNTIWLEESGLDAKEAFRVDRHSDACNLQYGGLYSGDVALYKRRFGAQCIGQPSDMEMEWTDGRGSKALRDKGKSVKLSRYFSGHVSKEVVLQPAAITKPQPLPSGDESLGYIPFRQELPEQGTSETGSGASHGLTVERYISQRTAEYNRNLTLTPHDIELWKEFVAFQDTTRLWSGRDAGARSDAPALLERKVSILERALESNPTSVDLLVLHMALVGRVWEYTATMKKWKEIVFRHPNKPLLWLQYIQFCQSNFSTFSATSLMALFAKCISTLTSILEGSLKSHRPEKDTPKFLLAIFAICCNFLRQIGQTERAIACYQALIEFNLCSPPELDADDASMTTPSRLEFFEAFWDSRAPRFGEEGAPGWAGWTKRQQSQGAEGAKHLGLLVNPPSITPETSTGKRVQNEEEEEEEVDPEIKMVAGQPLDKAWLSLETHRSSEQSLPWRPGPGESEEDCIDPDRMVLFEDVKQYMFRVTDPALQLELLQGFLHFLGAAALHSSPLLSCTLAQVSPWLEFPGELFASDSSSEKLLEGMFEPHCPHQSLGCCIGYEALPSGSVLELASSVSQPEPHTNPAMCSLVSRVCNHSLSVVSDPSSQTFLAELWVASQLPQLQPLTAAAVMSKQHKAKVKSLQKLVKRLLQVDAFRSSLRLWNCCALIEHTLGNYSDAVKIYRTVLSQYSGADVPQITLLYRCMYECLLPLSPSPLHCDPPPPRQQEALNALVCLTEGRYSSLQEGTKVSPGRILRARSSYQQNEPSRKDSNYIQCHALFEYLTAGLQSACAVLDRATASLASSEPSPGSLRELDATYRCQIRLLKSQAVVQPAILRKVLTNALTIFPDSAWFLRAFIESEEDSFISGRLRRYFDSRAPSAVTAVPWLAAVLSDLKRYARLCGCVSEGGGGGWVVEEPVTGTVHRIKAVLARATASESGRLCPLLWRLRMAIERDEKQVKAVFYQAIQQCPSAKVLYLDAVALVPGELGKVLEMLEEKELRVRAPLEEVKLLLNA